MKRIVTFAMCVAGLSVNAQIKTPQPSPSAKISQTVGLTEVSVEYSRPVKRDRVIFGDLVPYDKMWRTGANKNTIISTSDIMIFGNDTLQPGSYALFTTPRETADWDIYFYKNTENWGTPENWQEDLVALHVKGKVATMTESTESFTIGVNNVTSDNATLDIQWDNTKVSAAFSVATNERVMASIETVMNGPTSGDYYKAADYYLTQKKDLDQALIWMNKSLEMRGGEAPFWMLRKKSLIQAELGQYSEAIETANQSLAGAEKAGNDGYVKMNKASIEEWTKKAKRPVKGKALKM